MKLKDIQEKELGELNILKEWESSEKEILAEFADKVTLTDPYPFTFILIGYYLGFEHKFLSYRSDFHKIFPIEITTRPHIDLHQLAILLNGGEFKGTKLNDMTNKPSDGRSIPTWYENKEFGKINEVVKGYLRNLGLRFNSEDYKQVVRIPRVIRQREEPVTKEMIVKLLRCLPSKLQIVVLVLSASGIRLGELVQLELDDIDFETTPTTIRLRAETTKTRTERETFLTTEATNSLKDHLTRSFEWIENSNNSHLKNIKIFGRTSKVINLKRKSNPQQPRR